MSLRVVIVEDDNSDQELLKIMLRKYFPDIELLGSAYDVSDGLYTIKTTQPDLVFLDVQLWSGTCFDLLEQLESIDFDIIFTTSYSEHAVEAFRLAAVDYLLKPISPHSLTGAISKSEIRRSVNRATDSIENLLSYINGNGSEVPIRLQRQWGNKYFKSRTHKLNRIEKQEAFKISHKNSFDTLTKRELEIIQLLIDNLNNRQIAEKLFISRYTVEQHRKNINRKLEINSFAELFQYALAFDMI